MASTAGSILVWSSFTYQFYLCSNPAYPDAGSPIPTTTGNYTVNGIDVTVTGRMGNMTVSVETSSLQVRWTIRSDSLSSATQYSTIDGVTQTASYDGRRTLVDGMWQTGFWGLTHTISADGIEYGSALQIASEGETHNISGEATATASAVATLSITHYLSGSATAITDAICALTLQTSEIEAASIAIYRQRISAEIANKRQSLEISRPRINTCFARSQLNVLVHRQRIMAALYFAPTTIELRTRRIAASLSLPIRNIRTGRHQVEAVIADEQQPISVDTPRHTIDLRSDE